MTASPSAADDHVDDLLSEQLGGDSRRILGQACVPDPCDPRGRRLSGMRRSVAVVREWELSDTEGATEVMQAASLVKQVVAHVALDVLDDLDEAVADDITVRHVLIHTTGLPNWRPEGAPLRPLRPPGSAGATRAKASSSSKLTSSAERERPSHSSSTNMRWDRSA